MLKAFVLFICIMGHTVMWESCGGHELSRDVGSEDQLCAIACYEPDNSHTVTYIVIEIKNCLLK